MTSQRILTVTQFNNIAKMILENDPLLAGVTVAGEISNFKRYPSGHIYFTLKDESGALSCVMFSSYAYNLKICPFNGMQARIEGSATVYGKDGRYQFLVRHLEVGSVGDLYAAYEKLKEKLNSEGLFDQGHKKALPAFPQRVGVITSPVGAAYRDILNVTERRFPVAEILLYPSAVQGEEAPGQLLEAVRYFSDKKNIDVLIIGRGGGSMEDLWAFNDERLARALYACPIPTISAVGHETDYTICDFVCDRRAPTPSAAAELAVPDRNALLQTLADREMRLHKAMNFQVGAKKEKILHLKQRRVLTDRQAMVDVKKQRLKDLSRHLKYAGTEDIGRKKNHFGIIAGKMAALNPIEVLKRGYSASFDKKGKVIRSVENLRIGQTVYLKFFDGNAKAEINEVQMGEGKNGNKEEKM